MVYYSEDDIYPVTRITTGAVGEPGRRVFLLQAQVGDQVMSWVVEKAQVTALGEALPQLLAEVRSEFPELGEPLVAATPNLALREPLEPEFRVGSIGVGYDRLHDLVVLTLAEADSEDSDPVDLLEEDERPAETYVYTTRGQAWLLGRQAEEVVAAGRPHCPSCGEPIDDFGHFCLPVAARGWRKDGLLQ
jgi:uncharacterized repeat protein (TIGR03847 family)